MYCCIYMYLVYRIAGNIGREVNFPGDAPVKLPNIINICQYQFPSFLMKPPNLSPAISYKNDA